MDASESSASKIFVDSSGCPLPVFIADLETISEGEGLKLVRQLKVRTINTKGSIEKLIYYT